MNHPISHTIFFMLPSPELDDKWFGAPPDMAPVTISVLNLVDLAGSERLSQAASEDAEKEKLRQKEVRQGCHREGADSV